MKIETLTLGQLQTNCYLVYDPLSNEGIIIDPADEAEFIAEKIQKLKLKPKAIIATHGHFDHVLAAGELQMFLNKFQFSIFNFQKNSKFQILNSKFIPFYIHQNDLFLLKQMNQSASHWLGLPISKPQPLNIKFLVENDVIKFGKFCLRVLETPGHTPGSISLFSNQLSVISKRQKKLTTEHRPLKTVLFSGDTLFKSGIGRYDFSYSDKKDLEKSLDKMLKLPSKTIIYSGHGDPTTIKKARQNVTCYMLHIR